MRQIASMFARLAGGKEPLLARSFAIMRAAPFMVGGTRRFDTDLMLHSHVVSKVGGEGVEAVAVPAAPGRKAFGIAVKIADGNFRALYPVVVSLLKRYDVLTREQLHALQYYSRTPLKNHAGKEIGSIQSVV
jgi:L-asparaginase II